MCFRPSDVDVAKPGPCPHCGKMVFPSDGIIPKKCPFCREPLVMEEPVIAATSAPAAPAAHVGMPVAPTATPPSVPEK